jgi:flagellar basal body rod protein FlgG
MSAARGRLDIATENLANGSTDGFRRATARGTIDATGVHIARETDREQGALRRTGRTYDLALAGSGEFTVRDFGGRTWTTRNGGFTRDRFNHLSDDAGRVLLGAHGPLYVPEGAAIEPDGNVSLRGTIVDRLPLQRGTSVQSGMLESSNVNAIGEMVDVLTAQRSFESAQKVLSAIDAVDEKSATAVAKLQ